MATNELLSEGLLDNLLLNHTITAVKYRECLNPFRTRMFVHNFHNNKDNLAKCIVEIPFFL